MAGFVLNHMADYGTKILRECVPASVERLSPEGPLTVNWKGVGPQGSDGSETFDTVMMAIGQYNGKIWKCWYCCHRVHETVLFV